MKNLRVLSYNIHKGFSSGNLNFILKDIKDSIEAVHADLVLLQEVLGHHEKHAATFEDWPTVSQFEFLADRIWPHFAYGKNAIYTEGHHGNAILSKFPISFWENQDVSYSSIERRGLLHAVVDLVPSHSLHVFCVHLGLFERDRVEQVISLCHRIKLMVPPEAPLLIGGDFNDWRERMTPILEETLGVKEAFLSTHDKHASTFPSFGPFLKLDRLYYRGIECVSAELMKGKTWKSLSDHLPILAEFNLNE